MTQDVYTHVGTSEMEDLKRAWQAMFVEAAAETNSAFAGRLLPEAELNVASINARTYVPAADLGE